MGDYYLASVELRGAGLILCSNLEFLSRRCVYITAVDRAKPSMGMRGLTFVLVRQEVKGEPHKRNEENHHGNRVSEHHPST